MVFRLVDLGQFVIDVLRQVASRKSSQAAMSRLPRRWNSISTRARANAASQAATVEDEDHQHLAAPVVVPAAPGHEADRDALQHHLGRQEHDDHVPPAQKADQPDAEQHRAHEQRVVQQRNLELIGCTEFASSPVAVCGSAQETDVDAAARRWPPRQPGRPAAACRPLRRRSSAGRTIRPPSGRRARPPAHFARSSCAVTCGKFGESATLSRFEFPHGDRQNADHHRPGRRRPRSASQLTRS